MKYIGQISVYFFVAKSYHPQTFTSQHFVACSIIFLLSQMCIAVEFNDQTAGMAVKIQEIATYYLLTTKM